MDNPIHDDGRDRGEKCGDEAIKLHKLTAKPGAQNEIDVDMSMAQLCEDEEALLRVAKQMDQPKGPDTTTVPGATMVSLRRGGQLERPVTSQPGAVAVPGVDVRVGVGIPAGAIMAIHTGLVATGSSTGRHTRTTDNDNGLAEAVPVQNDEESLTNNTPRAQQVDLDQVAANRRKKQRKEKLTFAGYLLLGITIVVAVVVAVVLVANDGNDNERQSLPNATSEMPPPPAPAPAPYIVELPAYTWQAMREDPESPQAKAFTWLQADPSLANYTDARRQQRMALVTFYHATGGNQWADNNDWLSYDVHECLWWHREAAFAAKDIVSGLYPTYLKEFDPSPVRCDANGLYNNLWLDSNNLIGSLPAELALLSTLKTASLVFNHGLQGTIPSEYGLLTALEGLYFYGIMDAGRPPSEIGLLTNLQVLNLGNQHTGLIPSEIWHLTGLSHFHLAGHEGLSQLSGTIPTEIGLMTKLISLQCPKFQGTLPTSMGLLTRLEWIEIRRMHLTGTVPSEIGLWSNAEHFSLHGNALTGTIPTEIGLLTNIKSFEWGFNVSTIDHVGTLLCAYGFF